MPLLGSLPRMQRDPLGTYIEGWRTYGDVARYRLGPLTAVMLAHPDHAEHVLLHHRDAYAKGIGYAKLNGLLGPGLFTSEGELWHRQRRLMAPLFTPRAVSRYVGAIAAAAEGMLDRWQPWAEAGQPFDVGDEMMRLAMSVIGRAVLGVPVGEEGGTAEAAGRALTVALEFIMDRTVSLVDPPLFLPTPMNRRYLAARRTLDQVITRIIAERRARPDQQGDLVGLLLAARDDETGKGIDDAQLRAEVMTIFLAGHETTAQALTWTWYLLTRHPHAEARLCEEVAAVLDGRQPTADDLPRLAYTRAVVEEAMRLYPPVWAFPRSAVRDDVVGGHHVPAGALVLLSPYITHRHPAFWDDPERFDPTRFLPDRAAQRPRLAYFPFGGGPRTCLGNSFALMETQVIVAMVVQRYALARQASTPVAPRAVGTLRPAEPVMLTARPRSRTPLG